jgi:hypothetical protein
MADSSVETSTSTAISRGCTPNPANPVRSSLRRFFASCKDKRTGFVEQLAEHAGDRPSGRIAKHALAVSRNLLGQSRRCAHEGRSEARHLGRAATALGDDAILS